MRKNFMKKAVAVTLSAAMTFSLSAVTNPTTASAATVGLVKVTKTMKIGKKFTIKLNKAGQKKWKITKATSAKPKVVKVQKTTKKTVVVKSLKKGTSLITLKLKKKNGKAGTKTLKCKIYVKEATTPTTPTTPTTEPTTPSDATEPTTAVKTEDTVSTQEELIAALDNKDLKVLTLDTEEEKIDIPEVDRSDLKLIVNAPKTTITNKALFSDVEIKAISDDTWIEESILGEGNLIVVTAPTVSLIVKAVAKLRKLTLRQSGAAAEKKATIKAEGSITDIELAESTDMTLDVQGEGKVENVNIKAGSDVTITGGATANKVNVTVDEAAADTNLSSDVKVDITLNAVAKVELKEGAADSTIKAGTAIEGKDIEVKNDTGKPVEFVAADGVTKNDIPIGNNDKVTAPISPAINPTNPTEPTTPSRPDFNNGGTSSSNTENTYDGDTPTVNVDDVSAEATVNIATVNRETKTIAVTGSATEWYSVYTVSGVSIQFDASNFKTSVTSGCVINYDVIISGFGTTQRTEEPICSGTLTGNSGKFSAPITFNLDATQFSKTSPKVTNIEDTAMTEFKTSENITVRIVAYVTQVGDKMIEKDKYVRSTVEATFAIPVTSTDTTITSQKPSVTCKKVG